MEKLTIEDMKNRLQGLPELLSTVGATLAERKREEALAKLTKEKTSSELDALARESLGGDKKPTEAAIANWIKSHPAMQNAEQVLVEASYQVDVVRASYEALRASKDIFVTLLEKESV